MFQCSYCGQIFETKSRLGGHKSHCTLNPNYTRVYICEFCNVEVVGLQPYKRHVKHCKMNPEKVAYKTHQFSSEYIENKQCRFCQKTCKNINSLKNHENLCPLNPNRHLPIGGGWPKGKQGWSKGLTKETDIRLKHVSEQVLKYYESHDGTFTGKHHTKETKKKLSDIAKDGSYEKHFGTYKKIIYKNCCFQSTYEVEVAKSLDDNGIRWTKPKRLKYTDPEGNIHYYTADLYLPDYDIYLDPKNDYLINNVNTYFGYKDSDKIQWVQQQNNVKILILNKNQLNWNAIRNLIDALNNIK